MGLILLLILFCIGGLPVIMVLIKDHNRREWEKKTYHVGPPPTKEERQKKYEIEIGPSNYEKYIAARKMYFEAHPMMCEIVNRGRDEILKMVLMPKNTDIRVYRDLYRIGRLFDFTIPELSLGGADPKQTLVYEQKIQKVEQWKKNIGISDVYDDPFEAIDPYEKDSVFFERGCSAAKKYGYWEGFSPNIFQSNEKWWEDRH